ncbi:hypothetical protein R5W23_006039, partial [Gemmata sp. JC673]|nr:hypothetical protein [Gemmata algarum]
WAKKNNLKNVKTSPPSNPTKAKTERIEDKSLHVSTARLLADDKRNRQSQKLQQPYREWSGCFSSNSRSTCTF